METSKPWKPAPYELADISAIQNLLNGTATPEQQKRGILWIIHFASGVNETSFYPGGEEGRRDTDFAEGRRYVGNQIIKMNRLDLAKMRRKFSNSDPHEPKA